MEYRLERKRIILYIALAILVSFTLLSLYPRDGSGDSPYRDPENLKQLVDDQDSSYLLLDVRTPSEYSSGYIPTAQNLPLQILGENLPETSRDSLIILYCRSGNRSSQAARLLQKEGYTNVVDFGGINRWPYGLNR
ncbi:rhodanese-like domain-containing protein [Marispirochaeta aestuarii]|uniref:rhodanese-like domain-containing protein n=1 Tax=Marispirochaeta aestuarii TaxID=1963862 RepID=UPI0029C7B2D0|nr:rhodanese-like domain-containing protein [Marispirochaeta aestuarii]